MALRDRSLITRGGGATTRDKVILLSSICYFALFQHLEG